MTYKKNTLLINVLFYLGSIISAFGIILKILDFPYNDYFLIIGVVATIILASIEIKRLKRVINDLTGLIR